MQKTGLQNYTAGEHHGGQGVGVVSCLPWVGMAALAQPMDLCMEWFLTCAGPSPAKAILGLIWGGTDQQRLIKNFFAEVMLLTSPLSKNWFKPQISGGKDAEFAGKEA